MKRILSLTALVCMPFISVADESGDANCPVGATVMKPISLEQTQVANYGKIPSSNKDRYVYLSPSGNVRAGETPTYFPHKVASVDSEPGQFRYSGTEGYAATISGDLFSGGAEATCNQGTYGDMAIVVREMMDGESRVWDGLFRGHWEYDQAVGNFDVGVIMGIKKNFVGLIKCDYQLSATYL